MGSLFQVGKSYYEAYIVDSRSKCEKSVVLLLSHKEDDLEKKNVFLETGIIIASGQTSCCLMTSHRDNRRKEVCEVHFVDGTIGTVSKALINPRKPFGMDIIVVLNVSNVEPVRFAHPAIHLCERVFTCGYNTNQKGRCFFSGSIVSGVGLQDKTIENANLLQHGCSTGIHGHLGSAVFDERQHLVGMNVLYARSKGDDYVMTDQKETDFGGIVSALDLPSINLGLASSFRNMDGKSTPEIVKYVTDWLLSLEADESPKPKEAKDVGTSKAPAGGG